MSGIEHRQTVLMQKFTMLSDQGDRSTRPLVSQNENRTAISGAQVVHVLSSPANTVRSRAHHMRTLERMRAGEFIRLQSQAMGIVHQIQTSRDSGAVRTRRIKAGNDDEKTPVPSATSKEQHQRHVRTGKEQRLLL